MDHSVADRFGTTNYRKNNLYPKVNHHKKKVVLFRMMMNPYYTLKKRWFVNQPIKMVVGLPGIYIYKPTCPFFQRVRALHPPSTMWSTL